MRGHHSKDHQIAGDAEEAVGVPARIDTPYRDGLDWREGNGDEVGNKDRAGAEVDQPRGMLQERSPQPPGQGGSLLRGARAAERPFERDQHHEIERRRAQHKDLRHLNKAQHEVFVGDGHGDQSSGQQPAGLDGIPHARMPAGWGGLRGRCSQGFLPRRPGVAAIVPLQARTQQGVGACSSTHGSPATALARTTFRCSISSPA